MRGCSLCDQVDDGPRHVLGRTVAQRYPAPSAGLLDRIRVAAPAGDRDRIIGELTNGRGTYRHITCCAQAGCPDGTCDLIKEQGNG